jgi:hypothetical protein
LRSITDAEIESVCADIRSIAEYNKKVYMESAAVLDQLKGLAQQLFRANSREMKYIAKLRVPCSREMSEYDFRKKVTDARARKRKEDSEKAANVECVAQTVHAVKWLEARGKIQGTDFEIANAIEVANDLAYEQEAERLQEEGGMRSFSGDDSCENCGGWDGVSHRCECGNRRVSWAQGYGHSFKNPYVYAEAY